ncbi:Uma2 family endonuclease [Myxacorys almedinensis]|uniref:Uma2 family endonuclease n=1 Tax=Myxacorys almedinensis A TaxID=2690445 RepID=A0A8J8CHL5_9CYAN|nr:Uma2 family endonuclease [Myxacorys almedinensis]NDJ16848.1 Uma2 family endonuclease [Myxacorys almedinensis A]
MTSQTISAQEQGYYTPEEYLELERNAEFRSEYDDGKITPMTGGTTNYNRLSLNCALALSLGLKGQDYSVFMADVKLWLPKSRKFRYPDVMVVAGQVEYYNDRKTTITNPQVIIEVLSDSTEDFDRNGKFTLYQSIPTFQEYILIDQNQIAINQFFKTGHKRWTIDQYDKQDSELVLKSFALKIAISAERNSVGTADLYEKIDFANNA